MGKQLDQNFKPGSVIRKTTTITYTAEGATGSIVISSVSDKHRPAPALVGMPALPDGGATTAAEHLEYWRLQLLQGLAVPKEVIKQLRPEYRVSGILKANLDKLKVSNNSKQTQIEEVPW